MRNPLSVPQTTFQLFGGVAVLLAFTVILRGQRAGNHQIGWEYLVLSDKIVLEDAMEGAAQFRGKQRYFSKEAVDDERLLDMLGMQG